MRKYTCFRLKTKNIVNKQYPCTKIRPKLFSLQENFSITVTVYRVFQEKYIFGLT